MAGDYPYGQQQKDFLKAQFIYASKLKAALDAGTITQDYYDSNVWLSTQSLENPYFGFANEFITAVNEEDLNWLGNQIGQDVQSLTAEFHAAVHKVVSSVVHAVTAPAVAALDWGLVIVLAVVAFFVLMHD